MCDTRSAGPAHTGRCAAARHLMAAPPPDPLSHPTISAQHKDSAAQPSDALERSQAIFHCGSSERRRHPASWLLRALCNRTLKSGQHCRALPTKIRCRRRCHGRRCHHCCRCCPAPWLLLVSTCRCGTLMQHCVLLQLYHLTAAPQQRHRQQQRRCGGTRASQRRSTAARAAGCSNGSQPGAGGASSLDAQAAAQQQRGDMQPQIDGSASAPPGKLRHAAGGWACKSRLHSTCACLLFLASCSNHCLQHLKHAAERQLMAACGLSHPLPPFPMFPPYRCAAAGAAGAASCGHGRHEAAAAAAAGGGQLEHAGRRGLSHCSHGAERQVASISPLVESICRVEQEVFPPLLLFPLFVTPLHTRRSQFIEPDVLLAHTCDTVAHQAFPLY